METFRVILKVSILQASVFRVGRIEAMHWKRFIYLAAIICGTLSFLTPVNAACTLPFLLTNGTTADATQVMGNLTALVNCLTAAPAGSTNAIQFNAGSGTFGGLGPLTNGQLVIGSTGAAPQAATITAGTGITVTNSAGSITIAAPGSAGLPKLTSISRTLSNQSMANNWNTVSYDTIDQDDVGAFSLSSPSTIVVPAGVTHARFTVYCVFTNNPGGNRYISLAKNGTTIQLEANGSYNESGHHLVSRWLNVASGDSFQIGVNQTGTLADLTGTADNFATPSFLQVEWY